MKLTDFKALTFDCYGTLIDWESGMAAGLAALVMRAGHNPSRDDILAAHARYESAQQAWTPAKPYRDVLAAVYRRLAEEWGVTVTHDECAVYGRSVANWRAFDDSGPALHYLKEHYKLIILSNVDNESFKHSNERLGVDFDAVYTAEDIGSYKPAIRNFDYLFANLSTLGIEKGDILHTAESLFHDIAPANECQLASCHINRRHDQAGFGAAMTPAQMPKPDFTFNSMAELVDAHRAAL